MPFRAATHDRIANAIASLKFIYHNFPDINVIIVEQDREKRIDLSQYAGKNFEYIFAYNSGLFNRGWALNIGIKASKKDHFCLVDTDMIMDPSDFLKAMKIIKAFEVVRPYSTWYWVDEKGTLYFKKHTTEKINFEKKDTIEAQFAAGMIMVQRGIHETIGGFEERFEGWSPEDQIYSHKLHLCTDDIIQLPYTIYHLEHTRSTEKMWGHKNFQKCWDLRNEVLLWDKQKVLDYAKETYSGCGNIEKYIHDKQNDLNKLSKLPHPIARRGMIDARKSNKNNRLI
jgi:glycosyltransferase involved in cell wall biosynthesis